MIPGALGTYLRCPLIYVPHAAQSMSTLALQGREAGFNGSVPSRVQNMGLGIRPPPFCASMSSSVKSSVKSPMELLSGFKMSPCSTWTHRLCMISHDPHRAS